MAPIDISTRIARGEAARRRGRIVTAAAGGFLVLLVLVAIFAPFVAPYDPNLQDTGARLLPPLSEGRILGSDHLGRDILSRIIYGARVSLLVGFVSVLIGGTIGVGLGLLAGYMGGIVDDVIRWLMNIFLAFPFILLVITVVAVFGSGLTQMIIVLGVVSWADYAKVLRGEALSVRERDYVEASRAGGAGPVTIMFRHILPNCAAPMIVLASFEAARMIIVSAGLDFLGLGVPASVPSWGAMLADGRSYLQVAWWLATIPGLAIMAIVVCLNLLGDWLRDYLDPKTHG
ncbi:MAG: ABC transporter permease [Microvirga sp.]|nr:ABC transporter permease [Microvirga sp.]